MATSLAAAFWDSFVDFAVTGQIGAFHHFEYANRSSSASESFSAAPLARSVELLRTPTKTFLPAVRRLVAIGDLHGDYKKSVKAAQVAGLVDESGLKWTGGDTTFVQVGDQLDRGDNEIKILVWLERLRVQADAAGGAVHIINGNHETLNVRGRFRYATEGGMKEFDLWRKWFDFSSRMKRLCDVKCAANTTEIPPVPESIPDIAKNRFFALRAGLGPLTQRFFAPHNTVQIVGSTMFVHGGVHPEHISEIGLQRINDETSAWMSNGKIGASNDAEEMTRHMPRYLRGRKGVVWSRHYSDTNDEKVNCEMLKETLDLLGLKRMVVGHTIQEEAGINSMCEGRVFRVDVGLSHGCGNGVPQALEITDDRIVKVLEEKQSKTSAAAA